MSYGILEESGETRTLGFAKSENHALILRIARPEYLLPDIPDSMPSPFYFNLWIKPDKNDPDYEHLEDDEWIMLTHDVPIKDYQDFRKQVKKYAKKHGISNVTHNSLRASVEHQALSNKALHGTVFRNFEEPEKYFLRSGKDRKEKKILDEIYKSVEENLGPDTTIQQMNQYILEKLAVENNLPTILLNQIDVYSGLNRRLTLAEIRDDMENRQMQAWTSPVGPDSDAVDTAAKKNNELTQHLKR